MPNSPSPTPGSAGVPGATLDQMWYLALHCRTFLLAHAHLERLGLMETGAPAISPIESNYHQFGAVHLLATLCVVDSKGGSSKGYAHLALESMRRSDLIGDLQSILDTLIDTDVSFGEALRERRNYDRTHGNLLRPLQSINRRRQKRSLKVYEATRNASGQHGFNKCWLQAVDAISRLADALEEEMGRIAPPDPPDGATLLEEVLPRIGGAIGLHRPPHYVAISFDPPSLIEFFDWRLKGDS